MADRKICLAKRSALVAGIVLAVIGLLFAHIRSNADLSDLIIREENPAGISEQEMREENQTYEEDGRVTLGSIGDSMAVFLQHREDLTDLDADIYVKQEDSTNWFLYGNVPGNGTQDSVYQLECEGNEEYVLLYFGTDPIGYIEAEKEDGSAWVLNPEMGKPFAYVMKHSWNVAVYDMDGNLIEPNRSAV